jgi:CCR4-NOT complex subunit CAF16
MDEITVDMDVLGRMDLLEFFKQECEQRGATIVYATHIFDGLEQWVTHLAYVENGNLVKGECVIAHNHISLGLCMHYSMVWIC